MLRNTQATWGWLARSMHWLVALLLIAQVILGKVAEEYRLSPTKLDLFVWHKSIGITILALVVIRLGWRLANPTPALPGGLPPWERLAARLSHGLLYVLMLLLPLSGWVINSAANIPFKVYWLWELPDITGRDRAVKELAESVHETAVYLLVGLVLLHISAALYHHFRHRNNILRRMIRG